MVQLEHGESECYMVACGLLGYIYVVSWMYQAMKSMPHCKNTYTCNITHSLKAYTDVEDVVCNVKSHSSYFPRQQYCLK